MWGEDRNCRDHGGGPFGGWRRRGVSGSSGKRLRRRAEAFSILCRLLDAGSLERAARKWKIVASGRARRPACHDGVGELENGRLQSTVILVPAVVPLISCKTAPEPKTSVA